MSTLTRRRFLAIAATAVASPSLAGPSPIATWKGRALGAQASMQLCGVSASDAMPIFMAVEQELARLEAIFSLYRQDSEISRLNRDGMLTAPSPDFLSVLSVSSALHEATGGAFDPTIQPLWRAIAHGASIKDQTRAKRLVGWERLQFDAQRIAFKSGMGGITLNGIAQGAITDRIAALLQGFGLRDVLVDMGEISARGRNAQGTPWSVGIVDAKRDVVQRVHLQDRAIATSAPMATRFGSAPQFPHIFGTMGEFPTRALVTVSAPTATLADGLSTALCLVPSHQSDDVLRSFKGAALEVAL